MNELYLDIETTGLNPYHNRITCIGFAFENNKPIGIVAENERDILEKFNELTENLRISKIMTWNGENFDIPFLKVRSKKHGMYFNCSKEVSVDVRKLFPGFPFPYVEQGFFTKITKIKNREPSLGEAAEFFGIPGKIGDGKKAIKLFYKHNWYDLVNYCKRDVTILRRIYKELEGVSLG